MVELIEAGKVRWAGASNLDVDLLTRCEAVHHVDAVQPELNLLRRHACEAVIPWARIHGTGVIVYSPLASGILAGAYELAQLRLLDKEDWRRLKANAIVELVTALKRIATQVGLTLDRLAVAWTLAVEGVSGAICGARTPRQVDGWIPAAEDDLDEATRSEIDEIILQAVSVGLELGSTRRG
jgi:aryl-alcohol dehydrogenase-like predicted oxidoreductase